MRLYGYWRSSASWRVRIGLHLKGVDFENTPVHLREGVQHSAEHVARNPMHQVPVLVLDDGTRLTQSLAILEWLDETLPQPALLPTDPRLRQRVRQAAEIVNAGIQPVQNLAVLQQIGALGGDRMAWAHDANVRGLTALEALARETAGDFLVADAPSLADICLVPQLYNARRFAVDLSAFPTLVRVESACAALPAFQAAHPDAQPDANS